MSTEVEYYVEGKTHYPSAVGNPWVTKRIIIEAFAHVAAKCQLVAKAADARQSSFSFYGKPVNVRDFVAPVQIDVVNEVLVACGESPRTQEQWDAEPRLTPEESQRMEEDMRLAREAKARDSKQRSAHTVRQPVVGPARYTKLSTVAQNGACPKCGGTQFKAKRSAIGKLGLGVLAPKTQVRCTLCGTTYRRG